MTYQNTLDFARQLDKKDPLKKYRDQFYIPQINGKPVIYFSGNSLGLQPKNVRAAIEQELLDWEKLATNAHFHGKNPWFHYHKFLTDATASIVGANTDEVVVMNSLTVNLHLMLVSFYRPTQNRYCIITENKPFPSDRYALESQVKYHGFTPEEAIIELMPEEGAHTLHTEDILKTIRSVGKELALVMIGGVNYYSGQAFDMEAIAKAAHEVGAVAGFDLAHAAGNLKMNLHDWNVDFAVWCTYKYLNSGPGGAAGAFVHEKHGSDPDIPRFAGWWGYDEEDRFLMKKGFKPMKGAAGWQLSNAPIFPMAVQKASLDIFEAAGMDAIVQKSQLLTGYLEYLFNEIKKEKDSFEIITPSDKNQRGCQLSLLFYKNGKEVYDKLTQAGVIADWREPSIIRVAPVPLYNTFEEVYRFGKMLKISI
ncbi:MAG: kynureninase [Cytophagales bacterium]|nr:kynureninase [Cytophagales bacterium]